MVNVDDDAASTSGGPSQAGEHGTSVDEEANPRAPLTLAEVLRGMSSGEDDRMQLRLRTPRKNEGSERRTRTKSNKIWEEPMPADFVEKSSVSVHTCPLCGSVRTGPSSLWQHLSSVHGAKLTEVGRWLHCGDCSTNFSHDATWRLHLTKTNCSSSSMSIRWREKKREEGSEEEIDESVLAGLDGRSKTMKDLKKRKRASAGIEEEAREKRATVVVKPYMQPRDGFVIVSQSTNFRCAVCGERDFPTLSSLVYHQRREHSMQLSQVEHWIHCSGCGQGVTSLSGMRNHVTEAATAAAAEGTTPSCTWSTALLSWQAEKDSEEATRFKAGLDPVPPSSGASSSAGGIKEDMLDGDDELACAGSAKKRKHNQRVDKSYILPRPGHTIIRRQHVLVCQLCGDGGFATCSSLDFHLRKVHKAGVHQAGMWMHCTKCNQDFCNISSVRTHVANEWDPECCGWAHIYMCWHEKEKAKSGNGVDQVMPEPVDDGMDQSDWPSTSYQNGAGSQEVNSAPPAKRHRKLFKPPIQADEGFVIVKRNTDLPCFGCTFRCPSLTTFISHMPSKHKLYFSDVGAWMTCACGREYTSTTALRQHLREEGVGMGCLIEKVDLCWQHKIGGRETETPFFSGVDPAVLPGRALLSTSIRHQANFSIQLTKEWDRGDEDEDRPMDGSNNGSIPPVDRSPSVVIKEEVFDEMDQPSSSNGKSEASDQLLPQPPPIDSPQQGPRRSDRSRQAPPRYKPRPGSDDAILSDLKSKMTHREAESGWVTSKKRSNLPCFGCERRFHSLPDFFTHMKSAHELHLWDIGATLECRCERTFLSEGTVQLHLDNEGAETGCTMDGVALCWKHRANREIETPFYSHYVAKKPSFVHQNSRQPVRTASIGQEPKRVERTRSGPATVSLQCERGGPRNARAAPAAVVEAVPGRAITSADLFASSVDRGFGDFEVKEEEMDFTEGDVFLIDGPRASGVIKEEEDLFIPAPVQNGRAQYGRIGDEDKEEHQEPKRMATFDPTGYQDGDQFVLRKTAAMSCRSCGVLLDNPTVLAAHLRTVHAAEMRGLRRDWHEQQWLECAACSNVFHAADDYEEHLREKKRRCTMADARLCWMEKMERENGH